MSPVPKRKKRRRTRRFCKRPLAAQTEGGQNLLITLVVSAGKVIKKFATAGHHTKESAARRNVLFVGGEVTGEMIDTTGE